MLTELRQLLEERYNTADLGEQWMAYLADENIDALEALAAERELYRWREPVMAAISAAKAARPVGIEEPEALDEAEPEADEAEESEEEETEADEAPRVTRSGRRR